MEIDNSDVDGGERQSQNLLAEIDVGLFIESIQSYEYLYNMTHKDYKNLKKKEFGMVRNWPYQQSEKCPKMWKLLRDRFVKEKNKCTSGSGAPDSSWVYFHHMLFYEKYTRPRKTFTSTKLKTISTSMQPQPSTSTQSSSRSNSACSVWSTTLENHIFSPESEEMEDEIPVSREVPVSREPRKEPEIAIVNTPSSSNPKAGKRKGREGDEFLNVAKKICETLDIQRAKGSEQKDANKTFAEYAYSRLAEMPADEAKRKRRKMLLILEDDE
ncbi:transcription factor Adf-1-like [Sitophilus oryzae]|uniref:Transcription factor Adf-1-like n=1 Tax=Sitophilus oryzae TaxID=7048 RepID=A0A6J2XZE2_SITOR|nr:transcription factor Adf-1-like [Sitophilus oryzae]